MFNNLYYRKNAKIILVLTYKMNVNKGFEPFVVFIDAIVVLFKIFKLYICKCFQTTQFQINVNAV